jgi:hypothetical protein
MALDARATFTVASMGISYEEVEKDEKVLCDVPVGVLAGRRFLRGRHHGDG